VLTLTARSQKSDVDNAFEAGADDHIVQPFSSRELIERIAVLLEPAPAN